jgi:putative ABC transport system permease protein
VRSHDVMVSEALARACWPNQDPVGQLMRPVGAAPAFDPNFEGWTVVGVVADMRMSLRQAPGLYFYSDEAWNPVNYDTFIVHLSGAYNDAIAGTIRREVYAFDPQLVVNGISTLDRLRENQLWAEHVADAVLKVLAGTAGLLTLIGIFSMLAYMVDCRMSEFGVRMAFGATSGNLIKLVMGRGVTLALVGLALGVGATFGLVGFLRAILYETSAQDPQVLLAVAMVLIASAALGAILPAYRATKADVVKLLRTE